MDPGNILDKRFNPYAVRDEEWIVVGYSKAHPKLGFREITYLSPSTFHSTGKNDLTAESKLNYRDLVRLG